MATSFGLVFFMLLGLGGGDLLDHMDSGYYWQRVGVAEVTSQAMIQIIDDPSADPTRRLMAIRKLGELGEQAHLEKLESLVDSKQPFVGQYARRSIAWIKGEAPEPAPPIANALLAKDVALLRHDATMAGQLKTIGGTQLVDWNQLIPDFPPDHWQSKQEIIDEMNAGIYEMVSMVGNVRMDAITFSVSFDQTDDGPVVFVVRGQYDRFAVLDALAEMDEGFKGYSVDDIEVLTLDDEYMGAALVMPSDEMLIAMISESGDTPLPVNEVVDLLAHGDAEIALNDEMRGQLDKIDREKARGWFITSVPPVFTQDPDLNELFGPLEAARVTATDTEDGKVRIDWVGEGRDEAAIAAAVQTMNGHLAEGRAEIRQGMAREPGMANVFQPMVELMDSIHINAEGKAMTGGMEVPGQAGTFLPMMFIGF